MDPSDFFLTSIPDPITWPYAAWEHIEVTPRRHTHIRDGITTEVLVSEYTHHLWYKRVKTIYYYDQDGYHVHHIYGWSDEQPPEWERRPYTRQDFETPGLGVMERTTPNYAVLRKIPLSGEWLLVKDHDNYHSWEAAFRKALALSDKHGGEWAVGDKKDGELYPI